MTIRAVCLYIGCFKSNILMIPAGLKSKCFLTASTNRASETFPVSNVIEMETGSATPIAYASCTSHCLAKPATIFLATYLAA